MCVFNDFLMIYIDYLLSLRYFCYVSGQKLHTNIKFLRDQLGFSKTKLATKLSVTTEDIRKWERGLSLPNKETFKKIQEVFNLDSDEVDSLLNADFLERNRIEKLRNQGLAEISLMKPVLAGVYSPHTHDSAYFNSKFAVRLPLKYKDGLIFSIYGDSQNPVLKEDFDFVYSDSTLITINEVINTFYSNESLNLKRQLFIIKVKNGEQFVKIWEDFDFENKKIKCGSLNDDYQNFDLKFDDIEFIYKVDRIFSKTPNEEEPIGEFYFENKLECHLYEKEIPVIFHDKFDRDEKIINLREKLIKGLQILIPIANELELLEAEKDLKDSISKIEQFDFSKLPLTTKKIANYKVQDFFNDLKNYVASSSFVNNISDGKDLVSNLIEKAINAIPI